MLCFSCPLPTILFRSPCLRAPSPRPQLPVQTPVLDGLADVFRPDSLRALQVGDGAGDLQDAVVRPGAEAQLVDGGLQQLPARVVHLAKLPDILALHVSIGEHLPVLAEPRQLLFPGGLHPFPDPDGGLPLPVAGQFGELHGRHLDMDVDPVQQRSAHLAHVFLDLGHRAGAGIGGVGGIAAGAPIRNRTATM